MRAMAELKAFVILFITYNVISLTVINMCFREGKIKHIGLSSISSATLRRAVKIAPVAAVQTEYSVFSRHIEGTEGTDLLATCRELGIAVVVACPLGRGLLTSTFSNGEYVGDE